MERLRNQRNNGFVCLFGWLIFCFVLFLWVGGNKYMDNGSRYELRIVSLVVLGGASSYRE